MRRPPRPADPARLSLAPRWPRLRANEGAAILSSLLTSNSMMDDWRRHSADWSRLSSRLALQLRLNSDWDWDWDLESNSSSNSSEPPLRSAKRAAQFRALGSGSG